MLYTRDSELRRATLNRRPSASMGCWIRDYGLTEDTRTCRKQLGLKAA